MNTKTWILVSLAGLSLIPKFRRPVVHVAVSTGYVVSQPFRHPKKDAKAIGGHVYHFVKGDR